ncbi:MAG: sortase [Chloroflexales bacterium]
MVTTSGPTPVARRLRHPRQRLAWTCGNLLLFGGLYLLCYVGGLYADVEYMRLAARGDSNLAVPRTVLVGPAAAALRVGQPVAPTASGSAPRTAGTLGATMDVSTSGQIASAPPVPAQAVHPTTVERLIIPSIKLDAKVIEVGWQLVTQDNQQVAVWQVAEYAVGQHQGSANPGEGGNIVLAGHVGGYGQVFRDLYYVHVGEPVVLYSQGRQYRYVIKERLVVDEEGASPEQRAANARLIAPTNGEVVTMITCWPGTGPKKFTQRVLIRAVPVTTVTPTVAPGSPEAR